MVEIPHKGHEDFCVCCLVLYACMRVCQLPCRHVAVYPGTLPCVCVPAPEPRREGLSGEKVCLF